MAPALSLPIPTHIKPPNPSPHKDNLLHLLTNCIRTRNLPLGRVLHRRLLHSSPTLDTLTTNSLISLYSKCRRPDLALNLFDAMPQGLRDLVSYTALISCLANNRMPMQALSLFRHLLLLGHDPALAPNEYTLSAVVQACTHASQFAQDLGVVVLGFSIKSGFSQRDPSVVAALIDMFAETRDLVSARKVFDGLSEKNVVVWTLMITRYAQNGLEKDAVDLFLRMVVDGFEPDRFTVTSVISAASGSGYLWFGKQLHCLAIKTGLASDACTGCSLVDMYSKCGLVGGTMDDSRKVFDRLVERNVMSWTAVISGYVQNGGCDIDALKVFVEMLHGRVQPNQFTYSSILKACANLSNAGLGEQVYARVVKSGLSSVNFVGNSLVSMYARSGRMEEARKAFDVLFDKNLISYNAIVDGYIKNSDSEEAIGLLHGIDRRDVGMTAFTFASLLSAAASLGVMGKGQQLHAQLLKAGFESDRAIRNALVSMYSKCGNIEDAGRVFSEMGDRNVITWTSMITGFAKHGHANLALESFDEMISAGVKPNEVTYVAVLSACSHVGLVREGKEHFETMQRVYRIVPRMDHYACMVDLLGRSGFLEEALGLIGSMPFEADALVWRTLLGACRLHGNVSLGEVASRRILEQEPDDPAAYVLLSNLYAGARKWEEAARVRKGMKERRVSKEAGLSWVEIGNRIHKFHAGDTSHERATEIYDKLDELVEEIKGMGYVADKSYVLHDIEDGMKEQFLLQHSEKIAVAFGLVSTSHPRPIRVFKNLRVCGDCHSAIKFISKASGRDIIVRDSNRFHRFSDGECSCGEYW
ncbi:putative pentatricopeptide repeat-containing protein, chloroplastic [Iris pallida]|uniref:Pentatricopeptide repeat-containing protein, chloroplastic n=1 Tax=Iris pallida TaxID=29817 RepID=A0AAX6DKZ4_IRIPA|nr:putative pentatricopeptide repeat-containing protein, chloroplastic [Iris pallida]